MKWLLTTALLGLSGVASACPPTNQHPDAVAAREEAFRERVRAADSIVYGVIERDITNREGRAGILRVLHVYRGATAPGQLVRMRYAIPPYPCGMAYIPPETLLSVPRGNYGVALLSSDGSELIPFTGFIGPEGAEWLIREGLIRSAREGAETETE